MEHSGRNHKAPRVSPARRIREVFGTARACAIAGVTSDALKKWDRRLSTGGQGGCVPAKYQPRYLSAAEAEGLPLTAADLIWEPVR